MPLIQWIMQNLQVPKKTQGVLVGGSANISEEMFFNDPTQVVVGGTATISTAHINRVPIKFNIGDTVFDSCNKSYVIISFEIDTLGQAVYTVVNNGFVKQIGERDLFNFQDVLSHLSLQTQQGEENVSCLPGGYPVYINQIGISGEEDYQVDPVYNELANKAKIKIQEITTKPLDNLPVYPGRRRVET